MGADLALILGAPGAGFGPTTYVTVYQTDPDTGVVVQTATNVLALKRNTGIETIATGGDGGQGGEFGQVNLSQIRIWATGSNPCPFVPKDRDLVLDAEGMLWRLLDVEMESFNAFYIAKRATQIRMPGTSS